MTVKHSFEPVSADISQSISTQIERYQVIKSHKSMGMNTAYLIKPKIQIIKTDEAAETAWF